jgi:hypothetical protein
MQKKYRKRINPFFIFVFAAIQILFISSANACGQCAASQIWKLFPPLLIWQWIGIAWFLTLSLLKTVSKTELRFIPHIIPGAFLTLLGLFFGFVMTGPITILPFLVIAFAATIVLLFNRKKKYSLRLFIAIYLLAFLSISAIMVTGILEIIHPTPKSPVDIILRWEGTGSERIAFSELRKAEPDSVSSYREIVRKGTFYSVTQAVKRLAIVGDPEIDVPLVINGLERSRANSYKYLSIDIEDVLRKMTGLSLPEGTPVKEWRDKWEAGKSKK